MSWSLNTNITGGHPRGVGVLASKQVHLGARPLSGVLIGVEPRSKNGQTANFHELRGLVALIPFASRVRRGRAFRERVILNARGLGFVGV